MKKKFFSGVFALALMVIAGYGVNRSINSNANLSGLALQNVLALADVENPDPGEIVIPPIDIKYFGLWLDCFNRYGDVIGKQYKCYISSQGSLDSCTDVPC